MKTHTRIDARVGRWAVPRIWTSFSCAIGSVFPPSTPTRPPGVTEPKMPDFSSSTTGACGYHILSKCLCEPRARAASRVVLPPRRTFPNWNPCVDRRRIKVRISSGTQTIRAGQRHVEHETDVPGSAGLGSRTNALRHQGLRLLRALFEVVHLWDQWTGQNLREAGPKPADIRRAPL